MTRLLRAGATVALLSFGSGILVAQGALAELGLTETTARNVVLDEIKSASGHRAGGGDSDGVTTLAAAHSITIAVSSSGRIVTWGEVRPWTRPGSPGPSNLSPFPILLWLDGLDQP